MWKQYIEGADVILIVIDSKDKDTFYVCRDELKELFKDVPIGGQQFVLVFNKIDLDKYVPADRIEKFIQADQIFKQRNKHTLSISAL